MFKTLQKVLTNEIPILVRYNISANNKSKFVTFPNCTNNYIEIYSHDNDFNPICRINKDSKIKIVDNTIRIDEHVSIQILKVKKIINVD